MGTEGFPTGHARMRARTRPPARIRMTCSQALLSRYTVAWNNEQSRGGLHRREDSPGLLGDVAQSRGSPRTSFRIAASLPRDYSPACRGDGS